MSSTVAVVVAKAMYSASMLDWETIGCFRAFQEIKSRQRKLQKPPVDLRSSRQPVQSGTEYTLRVKVELRKRRSPW